MSATYVVRFVLSVLCIVLQDPVLWYLCEEYPPEFMNAAADTADKIAQARANVRNKKKRNTQRCAK